MVVFNTDANYYHALDRFEQSDDFAFGAPIIEGDQPKKDEWHSTLGPKELGTTSNPMQDQVKALVAKIREGASKIELEFPGSGKGNSQASTPESYGKKARQDIRELAKATNIKVSTHATFSKQGFSGFDAQRGFSHEAAYQNLKEIKKAIQFAAEASTGGAIVFHTGEWNRPISDKWGKGQDGKHKEIAFEGFPEEEEKDATFYMVDERTGQFVSAISKNKELFRPVFLTAKDLCPEKIGKYDEEKNGIITEDDYVDMNHRWINEADTQRLFERVPKWNDEYTNFEVEKIDWNKVVNEAKRWNDKHSKDTGKVMTPEEMFVRIEVENQILQAKGSSLYHASRYNQHKYTAEKIKESLEFYEKLDDNLSEDEKWKLMKTRHAGYGDVGQYTPSEQESIVDFLKRQLKEEQDQMRYVHEASAAADAQAKEREVMLERVKPVENVGLDRSTTTMSRAGIYAMQQTQKHKKDLKEDLYIAPENWQAQQYGSHPDELANLVLESRRKMARELQSKYGKSKEEAKKLASNHIKSTIDIGHLNLWRQHFKANKGESEASRDKRFNKWAIDKTKEMIKAGIVGHLHLSDNMGFDDEHLTIGEGNTPIKEFVKEMEKAGFKDFVIEPGSFNPTTALPDAWKYLGSNHYNLSSGRQVPFGQVRQAHFGYNAPSFYIAGAYSPSNDWKLWSEVPLE